MIWLSKAVYVWLVKSLAYSTSLHYFTFVLKAVLNGKLPMQNAEHFKILFCYTDAIYQYHSLRFKTRLASSENR